MTNLPPVLVRAVPDPAQDAYRNMLDAVQVLANELGKPVLVTILGDEDPLPGPEEGQSVIVAYVGGMAPIWGMPCP